MTTTCGDWTSNSPTSVASGNSPPSAYRRPGRATWPPYEEVGEALWREGWAGLLAPSAARPDGRIACIVAIPWPPEHCMPIRGNEISEAARDHPKESPHSRQTRPAIDQNETVR